jgi:hypothetical protein
MGGTNSSKNHDSMQSTYKSGGSRGTRDSKANENKVLV